MHRAARRPLGLAGLALLVAAAAPPQRAPTPVPPFEQSIEVVETSVLVTPPPLRRVPALDEWRLLENGIPRTVERVEELGAEPWELAIWVDGPLCDQRALSRTLLALAFQAEALTRAGSVRVVVADPEPHTWLPATREPRVLVRALAQLAPQTLCSGEPDALFWQARGMPRATSAGTDGARQAVQPATREGAAAALASLRTLVEQRTSTIAGGAGGCQATAGCALLLIAHGYPLDADLRLPVELRPAAGDGFSQALVAATEDLARRLAVARWMVIALAFAPPPPVGEDDEVHRTLPPEARPGPEPFPQIGTHGPPGAPAPIRRLPRVAPPAAASDVFLLPEVAPLRRLAALTNGDILRVPEQLPPVLEALMERRRLWYRTTPFTAGESRKLEVWGRERRAGAPAWVGAPP